ncbi:MAG: restriction endonuclease subunit S [Microthrixaceae bacterium]
MTRLPADWPTLPLSEIADYSTGKTPARANASFWTPTKETTPWVTISDMSAYGTVSTTKEHVNSTALDRVFRGEVVPAGTLLMSFKLTIGRVATLGVPAVHNEAIISIYPKPGIDQRFLGYYLSQVDYTQLQDRQIKGNTLNKSKIDRIPVPILDELEQQAVADVLDSVWRAIEVERRAGHAVSELKRAVMESVFSRGLRGTPQLDTVAGELPEDWSVMRLDECADVISTRMPYSRLESMQPSADPAAVKVCGIKVSDMNRPGNEVELVSAALEVDVAPDVAQRNAAAPGTIIFPKRGAAIATNKKRIASTWTVFDPNVIGVQARQGMDQRFLFHWFQAFDLRSITEPGPTPQLNKKNLDPLLVPVPSDITEQHEIVEVLDAAEAKAEAHRSRLQLLGELFETLLHHLMSGEIRVDDLNLEALPPVLDDRVVTA